MEKIHQTVFRQIAEVVATVIYKGRLFQELVEAATNILCAKPIYSRRTPIARINCVLNRAAVMTSLARQIRANGAVGRTLGVIMAISITFKEINDFLWPWCR